MKIARLTVLSTFFEIGKRQRRLMANCVCDCGKTSVVRMSSLKCGEVESCGCLRLERLLPLLHDRAPHGHARKGFVSSTFGSWSHAKDRCLNPENPKFGEYGGRGIKFCDRWLDFSNFLVDVGEKPAGKTFDRINCNGNYEPGNCRWTTNRVQRLNQRRTKFYEFAGEMLPLVEISERTGIKIGTLWYRAKHENPLTEPVTA